MSHDYVKLVGAEDVLRAGHSMQSAADDISRAAFGLTEGMSMFVGRMGDRLGLRAGGEYLISRLRAWAPPEGASVLFADRETTAEMHR